MRLLTADAVQEAAFDPKRRESPGLVSLGLRPRATLQMAARPCAPARPGSFLTTKHSDVGFEVS
jgi:hypothetical protein